MVGKRPQLISQPFRGSPDAPLAHFEPLRHPPRGGRRAVWHRAPAVSALQSPDMVLNPYIDADFCSYVMKSAQVACQYRIHKSAPPYTLHASRVSPDAHLTHSSLIIVFAFRPQLLSIKLNDCCRFPTAIITPSGLILVVAFRQQVISPQAQ